MPPVVPADGELRLGAADDVPLQIAVAKRILHLVRAGARYVDVSVAGRPVALD